MRGHQNARTALPLGLQETQEILRGTGVKPDKRLVHNVDIGLDQEAKHQHHLLLHTFGEACRQVIAHISHTELHQKLLGGGHKVS